MRRGPLFALCLALAACRGGARAGADAGAPAEPAWPGLTLDLTPDPDHGEVAVEVRLSGERAAGVREITVARRWADTSGAEAVRAPRARDAEGEIPLEPRADDGGPDDVYRLARAPAGGTLALRYRARAASGGRSRFALRVAADRMSGVGHAFLMLPRLEERVPARVRVHVGALRAGADAASSFGFGREVVTRANSEELAHAVYVAGMLWREGEPGAEELVVLGDPPVDTRRALEHAVGIRAAVDGFFGATPAPAEASSTGETAGPSPQAFTMGETPKPPPQAFTFFLVAQPGLGRGHEGAYLTRSLGVWFDVRQPLDGALDLIVAHELTHRFLGGALHLVGRDGREAAWFSEGFTVHLARRAILDAGLLAPADYAADIRRALGAGDERLPDDYRRGALHAAWLDAALRRASAQKRSLADVVRALIAAGRASGGSLPVSALRDALARDLGPAGAEHVDRLEALDDAPVELPDDAFGPCARRVARESTGFDVGFDRRTLALSPAIVRGLSPGSAAEKAGLREGMVVLRARVPAEADALGASRAEVELVLASGKRLRYRPVGSRREVSWEAADCPAALRAPGRSARGDRAP